MMNLSPPALSRIIASAWASATFRTSIQLKLSGFKRVSLSGVELVSNTTLRKRAAEVFSDSGVEHS